MRCEDRVNRTKKTMTRTARNEADRGVKQMEYLTEREKQQDFFFRVTAHPLFLDMFL
jgi:negative regulator of genetic competence, sporulation and motility